MVGTGLISTAPAVTEVTHAPRSGGGLSPAKPSVGSAITLHRVFELPHWKLWQKNYGLWLLACVACCC